MDVPQMDLNEFLDAGYLQEVNRLFFHPLGLALAFLQDDVDGTTSLFIQDGIAKIDARFARHPADLKVAGAESFGLNDAPKIRAVGKAHQVVGRLGAAKEEAIGFDQPEVAVIRGKLSQV